MTDNKELLNRIRADKAKRYNEIVDLHERLSEDQITIGFFFDRLNQIISADRPRMTKEG